MLKKFILLAGLILALSPFVLFPVCNDTRPDGAFMSCFYSGVFICLMGVLIILFALIAIYGNFSSLCVIFAGVCAVMCWLVPNGIIKISGSKWACGLCANPEHSCRALTIPAVGIIAALIIIFCIVDITINFILGKK
ncbi:MAG: DUF4418 family protein [Synergistaceae bacterium]|nr:DUF4418 family protein [Synergistaceae bacterium]